MINKTDCYLAFGVNWGQESKAQSYFNEHYPDLAEHFDDYMDLPSLMALNEGFSPAIDNDKFGQRWFELEKELELEIITYGSQRYYNPSFFLAIKSTVLSSEESFSTDPSDDNYLESFTVEESHFSCLSKEKIDSAKQLADRLGIFSFDNPKWRILSASNEN
jgi:hypothetical protein